MKRYYKLQLINLYQTSKVSFKTLLKWIAASAAMGVICGFIGFLFGWLLEEVTSFREANSYMIFFLPCIGIVIMGLYKFAGEEQNSGTNLVIGAIQSGKSVPFRILPLIFSGTLLTHLCGGSAGREGAALQMGGSLGNEVAKLLKLDERDSKVLIMSGMSACFAALFGTPITAAIFSIEVISVGIMHYAALVPCLLSSLIASGIAKQLGLRGDYFTVADFRPNDSGFDISAYGRILLLALICALGSILFIMFLHNIEHIIKKHFKNPYIRIVFCGALVIIFTLLLNTNDFLGSGMNLIGQSLQTASPWYVFILKIIFTSITLAGGYKGGEIVPSLCIGATLGSFCSIFLGLPTDLCAASGMVGVFCGVTNCPISTLLLSVELFGIGNLNFYAVTIAACYLLSGYYSLYASQKIMYSKTKTEYINKQAK